MEFGKIHNVDRVEWAVPEIAQVSVRYLQQLKSEINFEIYMGAPAWGHKEWVGQIYPRGAKASQFLYHYSRNFNTIELNTTHYRIPTPDQAAKWVEQVSEGFQFCPKIFQGISHSPHGLVDKQLSTGWFRFLEGLKNHLGPCFLQLPPSFGYSDKAELFQFLKNWPEDFPLALEFRHFSWYEYHQIREPLIEYLQSRGIGLVITDVAGRRDVAHSSISAPFVFLRFIGNALRLSDEQRARAWATRFKSWSDLGLPRLYLMVHEPDDILMPPMAEIFLKALEPHFGKNPRLLKKLSEPQLGLQL